MNAVSGSSGTYEHWRDLAKVLLKAQSPTDGALQFIRCIA